MALDPFCQSHLAVLAEKQHVIILHLDLIDVSEHVIRFDNPVWSLLIALRSKHVSNIQFNSSDFILQWHNSTVVLTLIKSHHSDNSNGLGLQFPSLQTRQA